VRACSFFINEFTVLFTVFALQACTSADSGVSAGELFPEPAVVAPDVPVKTPVEPPLVTVQPSLTAQPPSPVIESDVDVAITLSLSKPANGKVTFQYTTSSDNATAKKNIDYLALNGRAGEIPAGSLSADVMVSVKGDSVFELPEFFYVIFSGVSSNAQLLNSRVKVTILNDDQRPLSDTGIAFCRSATVDNGSCPEVSALYLGQDAESGRDVTAGGHTDGRLGFAFDKLKASDGALLSDQTQDYSTEAWGCVRDKVTGLTWEVKGLAATARSKDDLFTWFDDNSSTNAGSQGSKGDSASCHGYDAANIETYCNIKAYTRRVNQIALCGFSDWRAPRLSELESILDYGQNTLGISIDEQYFPNTAMNEYWSNTSFASGVERARVVNFSSPRSGVLNKGQFRSLRLVRDGS